MLLKLNWDPPADYQRVFDLEIELFGKLEVLRDVQGGEVFEADDKRAAELLKIRQPDGTPTFVPVGMPDPRAIE